VKKKRQTTSWDPLNSPDKDWLRNSRGFPSSSRRCIELLPSSWSFSSYFRWPFRLLHHLKVCTDLAICYNVFRKCFFLYCVGVRYWVNHFNLRLIKEDVAPIRRFLAFYWTSWTSSQFFWRGQDTRSWHAWNSEFKKKWYAPSLLLWNIKKRENVIGEIEIKKCQQRDVSSGLAGGEKTLFKST